MTFLRIVISLYLFVEHNLFGKPVPIFPDHALEFRRSERISTQIPCRNRRFWPPQRCAGSAILAWSRPIWGRPFGQGRPPFYAPAAFLAVMARDDTSI